jgi:hypothetical protein
MRMHPTRVRPRPHHRCQISCTRTCMAGRPRSDSYVQGRRGRGIWEGSTDRPGRSSNPRLCSEAHGCQGVRRRHHDEYICMKETTAQPLLRLRSAREESDASESSGADWCSPALSAESARSPQAQLRAHAPSTHCHVALKSSMPCVVRV